MKQLARWVSDRSERFQVVWWGWLPVVFDWRGRDEDGWWSVQWGRQWYFGFPKAHTMRHPNPISRLPIWRWRVTCGPLEVRRWNDAQEENPHYADEPTVGTKLG